MTLKIRQYGKSSAPLIRQKQSFFNENDKHIEEQRKISDIYVRQPARLCCKNCGHPLKIEHDFIKDGIKYKICDTCTHLNGAHEDTDDSMQLELDKKHCFSEVHLLLKRK